MTGKTEGVNAMTEETRMTKEEAAAALDGNEYGEEGSRELFRQMKESGLVAVFGYSDDNMEFRGAEEDEVGCYNGGVAYMIDSDEDFDRALEREMAR